MRPRVLAALVVLALLVAAFVAATAYLWSLIGAATIPLVLVLGAVAVWGLYRVAKRALLSAIEAPFRLKGAALRGATATVHSVEPARAADGAGIALVDVSISPAPDVEGPFQAWDAAELRLVPPGTNPGDEADRDEDADGSPGDITLVEFWREGAFVTGEGPSGEGGDEDELGGAGTKVVGPARLRLHVRAGRERAEYQFSYYFETFGAVAIPADPTPAPAPPRAPQRIPATDVEAETQA